MKKNVSKKKVVCFSNRGGVGSAERHVSSRFGFFSTPRRNKSRESVIKRYPASYQNTATETDPLLRVSHLQSSEVCFILSKFF